MDGFDDELDIDLRDLDDIGCRIVLLSALSIWPEIANASDRRSWRNWLNHQGASVVATVQEHAVLEIESATRLSEAMVEVCERAMDGVGPLAWATALSDKTSLSESEVGPGELAESVPMPPESVEAFLNQLILRDENTIALERERAELWNWRLAAELIRRESTGRNLSDLEEAIREVVLESAISFALDEIDLADFLVDGVPVKSLENERLEALTVTSEERLRAFNWLCGLTEWDSIHIPE